MSGPLQGATLASEWRWLLCSESRPSRRVQPMYASGQEWKFTGGRFGAAIVGVPTLVSHHRQCRRPSAGLISRCKARQTLSNPAHIHGSPSLNTRHCLTSLGLGSKCRTQATPPHENVQSNGWRWSSCLGRGISGARSSAGGLNRRSRRASRSAAVAGRYGRMLKC